MKHIVSKHLNKSFRIFFVNKTMKKYSQQYKSHHNRTKISFLLEKCSTFISDNEIILDVDWYRNFFLNILKTKLGFIILKSSNDDI